MNRPTGRKPAYQKPRNDRYNNNDTGSFALAQTGEHHKLQMELNTQAIANIQSARADKSDIQKVRLNLNQISPDNLEKKLNELRKLLIGDRLLMSDEGFDMDQV